MTEMSGANGIRLLQKHLITKEVAAEYIDLDDFFTDCDLVLTGDGVIGSDHMIITMLALMHMHVSYKTQPHWLKP
jgi:glycerate kinase